MKLLGEAILFGIWGLLSFMVLPAISTLATSWQIVFLISWILALLATLFIFDLKTKARKE